MSMLADTDSQRFEEGVDVSWDVDCRAESVFLYAPVTDLARLGVFVHTTEPLEIGTAMTLRFSRAGDVPFCLPGRVQWVNPVKVLADNLNPGMGVVLVGLKTEDRERLIEAIHTIAYVNTHSN